MGTASTGDRKGAPRSARRKDTRSEGNRFVDDFTLPGLGACLAPGERLFYNQMVVDQLSDIEIDRLFHALADTTRRDIVVQAVTGEHSVSALARRYPMSITVIQKHVGVLESAGLVRKERRGREQIVTSEHEALVGIREVLDQLEATWRHRLARFGDVLAALPEGDAE